MYKIRSFVLVGLLGLAALGTASAAQAQGPKSRGGRDDRGYTDRDLRHPRPEFDRHYDWQFGGCFRRWEDARREADRLERLRVYPGYEAKVVRFRPEYDRRGFDDVYCVWYRYKDRDRTSFRSRVGGGQAR